MRVIGLLLLLAVSASGLAGIFDAPEFIPIQHQDGTKTFRLSVTLTKHHPTGRKRSEQIAGAFLARNNFCPNGWELTKEEEIKKRLTVEGRCK